MLYLLFLFSTFAIVFCTYFNVVDPPLFLRVQYVLFFFFAISSLPLVTEPRLSFVFHLPIRFYIHTYITYIYSLCLSCATHPIYTRYPCLPLFYLLLHFVQVHHFFFPFFTVSVLGLCSCVVLIRYIVCFLLSISFSLELFLLIEI